MLFFYFYEVFCCLLVGTKKKSIKIYMNFQKQFVLFFFFEYKPKLGDTIVAKKEFLLDSKPPIKIEEGLKMEVHEIDLSNGWINVDNSKWKMTEWIGIVNFMNIAITKKVKDIYSKNKYLKKDIGKSVSLTSIFFLADPTILNFLETLSYFVLVLF